MSNHGGFMVVQGRCCRCSREGDGMAFFEYSQETEIVVCPICLSSAYHHMKPGWRSNLGLLRRSNRSSNENAPGVGLGR